MGIGKYSPLCPNKPTEFNLYGEVPKENDFANFDDEGFDSYGYSSFNKKGKFVGYGDGIDRYGFSEDDYLTDYISGGNIYDDACHGYFVVQKTFNRELGVKKK